MSLFDCCGICIPERKQKMHVEKNLSSGVIAFVELRVLKISGLFTEPVKRLKKSKVFVRGLEIYVSSFECTTNSNHG